MTTMGEEEEDPERLGVGIEEEQDRGGAGEDPDRLGVGIGERRRSARSTSSGDSSELSSKIRNILKPQSLGGSSFSVIKADKFAMERQGGKTAKTPMHKLMRQAFADPEVESLFQLYYRRQKRFDMQVFLFAGISFGLYVIFLICMSIRDAREEATAVAVTPAARDFPILIRGAGPPHTTSENSHPGTPLGLSVAYVVFYVVVWTLSACGALNETIWRFLPWCVLATLLVQVTVGVCMAGLPASPSAFIPWSLVFPFLVIVTLPIRLRLAIAASVVTGVFALVLIALLPFAKHLPFQCQR
ncbi:unnamed protein product [Darwinula stevensoni]|uniref:Uncharacterized protein n=1 Tax=Darwinula stevensoni TaxID=69355 RepID=A0A7R8XET0_9CRUS|nr:unnamed protein product [Darwinula stevensoni]CAG0894773.1 unnamed protein product [Darwinula stevensoni]